MYPTVQVTLIPNPRIPFVKYDLTFQATPDGWVQLTPILSVPPGWWIRRSPENWVWCSHVRQAVAPNFAKLWESPERHPVMLSPFNDTYVLMAEVPEELEFNSALFTDSFPVELFEDAPGNMKVEITTPLLTRGLEMG